ncbi:MAG: RNA polymerase factor sigma-54 [Alphaproteobacteria bacterium]|nr:RNA polymerase factor sigma-54 [Alphaproteobacteria bacterium]
MVLAPRLDLRQSQNLLITPQLQQAIKLLTMSSAELALYVDQELEANPLLEVDDSADVTVMSEALGSTAERVDPGDAAGDERDMPFDYEAEGDDEAAVGGDSGGEDGKELGAGGWATVRVPTGADGPDMDRVAAGAIDLRSHLAQQLNIACSDLADRMIGSFLIEQLDENGYLGMSTADAAAQLGSTVADVERVLAVTQAFDPPGICARDLKECLRLQLLDRNRLDPAMAALIANLELIAAGDIKKLHDVCRVSDEDLRDMIAEVRALDPKPALKFERRQDETILPDVLMTPQGDGWKVELNPETMPRVLINQSYAAEVSKVVSSTEEKAFVQDRLQAANWLVRALQQRAETIIKVAAEIVRQQDAFFRQGLSHLKPLILKDISNKIEMHESTVSRVTSNKYMLTPRGTFELKYFFSHGFSAPAAGGGTPAAVRQRIKDLIDAEKPDGVLSDDDLVDKLQAEGLTVARRTVAKYRESLHIPSSVHRRRRYAMADPRA